MIATCFACGKRYRLADGAIPTAGRAVRCSACGQTWVQYPEAAPRLPLGDTPRGDAPPAFAALPPNLRPKWAAMTSAGPAPSPPPPAVATYALIPGAPGHSPPRAAAEPAAVVAGAGSVPDRRSTARDADAAAVATAAEPLPAAASVPDPTPAAAVDDDLLADRALAAARFPDPVPPPPAALSDPLPDPAQPDPAVPDDSLADDALAAEATGDTDPADEPAPRRRGTGWLIVLALVALAVVAAVLILRPTVPPSIAGVAVPAAIAGLTVPAVALPDPVRNAVADLPPLDLSRVPVVGRDLDRWANPPAPPPTPLTLTVTSERRTLPNGTPLLIVGGSVANPTDGELVVPAIEATLADRTGRVALRWRVKPPADVLAGQASAPIEASAANYPADAPILGLRFVAP